MDSLRRFIDQTIEHGADLVLPVHGGPVILDEATIALRAEVHETLGQVLLRGQLEGHIRLDVTVFDIIVFGAMLAQPLPHTPDWKMTARRQANIYFDGLAGTGARPH
jgi:hypothetical protein